MSELFLPCPVASWNELEEVDDQTKHCNECGIHVYKQKTPGAKCGIDNSDSDELSYLQFIMRFIVILVLAFGSSLFSGVYAQETMIDTNIHALVNTTTVRGQVFDENGEVMALAYIIIERDGERFLPTRADFDGNYCLDIPDSIWKNDEIVLSFMYVGYTTQHIKLSKPNEGELIVDVRFPEEDFSLDYIGLYMPLIDVDPDSKRMTTISGKDIRIMRR